ncbi:MAG: L-fucose:H+ symporter permease [Muribaculaceae bacterium]|nr:L-fucose:H+ symporter permease [Muribaculaceae bacterium]
MSTKSDWKKQYAIPFLLVSLLFLMWGIANNMNDTLLAAFKRIMSISDLQSSLVQFAFYGAYFCFAIPAALFIRKYSYKSGIILGLGLYALGTLLFFPAGKASSYIFFLFAIYVMAGGCAVLETTANPYILSMGDSNSATRRLNIAQTFNPVGALGGILLSRHFILSSLNSAGAEERSMMSSEALKEIQHSEFNAVSEAYLVIGAILILLLIVIAITRMPLDKDTSKTDGFGSTFSRLRHNRSYCRGVIAQFFYVGAQTCVWSFTIRYVMEQTHSLEHSASLVFLWSIIAFTAFRFIFTWLMKYFKPSYLLFISSMFAILATCIVIFANGKIAIIALISISAFMSLMFPTIYGISLERVNLSDAKVAASGLIMAILGGALLTPLQGWISDETTISTSFVVTLGCFVIVSIFALNATFENRKNEKHS